MTPSTLSTSPRLGAAALHHLLAVLLLGFASGLPLALTGQALQAWMTQAGLDLSTIGLLSLVGLPYTFKFLWAPLMDRYDLPWRGRRRGWLMATQLALAGTLWLLAGTDPQGHTQAFAALAVTVAFLSASQDVVIDAYRTELLSAHERGLGASMSVLGYRLAMIVSGGLAFIWVDSQTGNGWRWEEVYQVMAGLMVGAAVVSAVVLPRLRPLAVQAQAPAHAHPLSALLTGLRTYFALPSAWWLLLLIVLYKLGDAFAGSLMTPFLLKGMAFGSAEVGVVNKVFGLWLTIGGAIVGGALMVRMGLWRALMVFGVLQVLSNVGFWALAVHGQGALGAMTVPAFDWVVVRLAKDTVIDLGLLAVIAIENLTGGMGTAAFVAFLMALCRQGYTATQFALLSAFASVGRVWVGPLAGVMAESLGWPAFFGWSMVFGVPGLVLLWRLRAAVDQLDFDPSDATKADD